jgi:hypothetical protein
VIDSQALNKVGADEEFRKVLLQALATIGHSGLIEAQLDIEKEKLLLDDAESPDEILQAQVREYRRTSQRLESFRQFCIQCERLLQNA